MRIWLVIIALFLSQSPALAQQAGLEGGGNEEVQMGSSFYGEAPSPFSDTGFNNYAYLNFRANIGEGASFVASCSDGKFLNYINPLGDSERVLAEQRLGLPNGQLVAQFSHNSVKTVISLRISPTGLSLTGGDLETFSYEVINTVGPSDVAFSMVAATGEVIFAAFSLTLLDKAAFLKVLENCNLPQQYN